MKPKPLMYALIGAIFGGLLVAIVAMNLRSGSGRHEVLMSEMTTSLRGLKGDEFDKMFLAHMIEHHQAAIDMSRLSAQNAKHDEIKRLSSEIIAAQEREIGQMHQWQMDWGYETDHSKMGH